MGFAGEETELSSEKQRKSLDEIAKKTPVFKFSKLTENGIERIKLQDKNLVAVPCARFCKALAKGDLSGAKTHLLKSRLKIKDLPQGKQAIQIFKLLFWTSKKGPRENETIFMILLTTDASLLEIVLKDLPELQANDLIEQVLEVSDPLQKNLIKSFQQQVFSRKNDKSEVKSEKIGSSVSTFTGKNNRTEVRQEAAVEQDKNPKKSKAKQELKSANKTKKAKKVKSNKKENESAAISDLPMTDASRLSPWYIAPSLSQNGGVPKISFFSLIAEPMLSEQIKKEHLKQKIKAKYSESKKHTGAYFLHKDTPLEIAFFNAAHAGDTAKLGELTLEKPTSIVLDLVTHPLNTGIFKGMTALAIMAKEGHADALEYIYNTVGTTTTSNLIRKPLSRNAGACANWTLLSLAAIGGHVNVVRLILRKDYSNAWGIISPILNWSTNSANEWTAFSLVALRGDPEMLRVFLNAIDVSRRATLIFAKVPKNVCFYEDMTIFELIVLNKNPELTQVVLESLPEPMAVPLFASIPKDSPSYNYKPLEIFMADRYKKSESISNVSTTSSSSSSSSSSNSPTDSTVWSEFAKVCNSISGRLKLGDAKVKKTMAIQQQKLSQVLNGDRQEAEVVSQSSSSTSIVTQGLKIHSVFAKKLTPSSKTQQAAEVRTEESSAVTVGTANLS